MPELPEVETVRKDLVQFLDMPTRILDVQLNRKGLRFPFPPEFAQRLKGKELRFLERKGKALVFNFDQGLQVIGHLGMSGKIITEDEGLKTMSPHTHMIWSFENGCRFLYVDPRRFGFFTFAKGKGVSDAASKYAVPDPQSDFLNNLGPDALNLNSEERDQVFARLRASNRTLRSLLLDQRVLSGLGNIYVAEILFASRLHPEILGRDINGEKFHDLVTAVQKILTDAIERRGTTLKDYRRPDGSQGEFVHSLKVYGREGESCLLCSSKIKHRTVGGRSSFWCQRCQAKRKGVL